MIAIGRIVKDYGESGAMNALVPIHVAIDDGIFLTKAGDLVAFLGVAGVDDECLDPAEIDGIARRFESALRHLNENFRIYHYMLKGPAGPLPHRPSKNEISEEAGSRRRRHLESKAIYDLETVWAIVYEGWRPKKGIRLAEFLTETKGAITRALSKERSVQILQSELDQARESFANKLTGFIAQLQGFVTVRFLNTEQGYAFLRRLLNYTPFKADGIGLQWSRFVDYQACDSALECHRDWLRLDDYFVQVLTLKQPPAKTHAGMLRGLFDLESSVIITSEWRCEDTAKVRRLIESKRRHFHNSKASLLSAVNSGGPPGSKDVLIDDSALAMVGSLGSALEEIEVQGRFFGEFSLTVVLYDKDAGVLARSVAQAFKVMAAQDVLMTEERYNRLNAWLSVIPGNTAFNLRKLWLLGTNYADLSLLHSVDRGSPVNLHLGTEYLAILEGRGGCPYYFSLHVKDVAHTLILGATGSGKSFLLNFLITNLQKYEPFTYIFDLGGSYRSLARLFGASSLALGRPDQPFSINPFCLEPTTENLLFLLGFVKVLVESNGYRITSGEELDLHQQIENLYSISPDQRRLLTLANIVSRPVRQHLQKWVEGGPYARLFDNSEDKLTLARFQVFDFEGIKATDQLEPILFYVFHRANAVIYNEAEASAFKVFVMDEAWRFFRHPVIKAYIVEALKTWRKKNAAMILATQSSDDLTHSDMLPVVVESCPTKIFLANPGMDRARYRESFHLNETEADRVAELVSKRQMLLKRPDGSTILNLDVDPREYWIYTNNPADNRRKEEAFARYGFREGLESLIRGNS